MIAEKLKAELKDFESFRLPAELITVNVLLHFGPKKTQIVGNAKLQVRRKSDQAKPKNSKQPLYTNQDLILTVDYDLTNDQDPAVDFLAKISQQAVKQSDAPEMLCNWTLIFDVDKFSPSNWAIYLSAEVRWAARNYMAQDFKPWYSHFLEYAMNNPRGEKNDDMIHHLRPNNTRSKKVIPMAAKDFYEAVYVPPINEEVSKMIQVSELTTPLFGFQQRTVKWLLDREAADTQDKQAVGRLKNKASEMIHRVKDLDGRDCYMNMPLGIVSNAPEDLVESLSLLRGGILAEEMGLGKNSRTDFANIFT